jgi:hypothetical protein
MRREVVSGRDERERGEDRKVVISGERDWKRKKTHENKEKKSLAT